MVKGSTADQIDLVNSGDLLTIDSAFCRVPHATRILGNGNKTKTAAAIDKISSLLAAGVDPAEIRVMCPSSIACSVFTEQLRGRLDAAYAGAVDEIEVATTRELGLRALSTPEAQQAIGRTFPRGKARLVSAYEMDFILEDAKTLPNRPERLRQLLKFLFKSMTELADEGKVWLISVEEKETFSFLQDELKFLQVVLEPELANLATKALRASEDLKERFTKAHIIVVDYQLLSRASQLFCHLLADESITAIADPSVYTEVYDSYPYLEGIEEFLSVNENAETVVLDDQKPPTVEEIWSWPTLEDEISGAPNRICEQAECAEAPESVGIICFNPKWYNKILLGIRARGVPARGFYAPLSLKGDIRRLTRSLHLRMVTALRLLDNPADSMACRCWVGFGDRNTMNEAFVKARDKALAENPDAVFADIVADREDWNNSTSFIGECSGKTGGLLLDFLAKTLSDSSDEKIPALLVNLLTLGKDATPADMLEQLEEQQFFPRFSTSKSVTVTTLNSLAGLSFDKMILVGFVNGFFPHRSYFDIVEAAASNLKNIEETENHRFKLLTSAMADKVVMSHFCEVEQYIADELLLKSDRYYVNDNMIRISIVSLSVFGKQLQ